MKKYITSESVSYGHPDKLADQISDALLDAYLCVDNNVKAGIETMIKDNIVVLGGEVTTSNNQPINVEEIVKLVIKNAGYTKEKNLDPDSIKVINLIGKQSLEINDAVVKANGEIGSGDQGIMFGYAINETPNFMPLDIYIAKLLLVNLLKSNENIGPDAKSQVTICEENNSKYIDSILISTMHTTKYNLNTLKNTLLYQIKDMLEEYSLLEYYKKDKTKIFINPAGTWNIGGPVSDCGLTGRKIVVDQYGANCQVGGGAFSGKDSSKTDRSAAYLARYIAKNIVAANILAECKVEISYMIGVAEPSSIRISGKKNIFDENEIVLDEEKIDIIKSIFPITPKQIINAFDLRNPIFYNTAKYGHFGINNYPWEQLNKVNELKTKLCI